MNNNNSCSSLTFTASGTASSLTHSGTTLLTVNGPVTINQPTAAVTTAWNINGGTATVSGLITFAGTTATASHIGAVVITTGTLNANGGMTFVASAAATKVINMSGGAGVLNLEGALPLPVFPRRSLRGQPVRLTTLTVPIKQSTSLARVLITTLLLTTR